MAGTVGRDVVSPGGTTDERGLPHAAVPRLSRIPVPFFIGLKSDAIACRRSAAIEKAQHQNLRCGLVLQMQILFHEAVGYDQASIKKAAWKPKPLLSFLFGRRKFTTNAGQRRLR